MLRRIYCRLLRLHPPGFRMRFADEMLSVFDQSHGTRAALTLLADGFVSLFCQWILRPEFWHEKSSVPAEFATDGTPSFSSIDPFRPSTSALFHGLVLTSVVFCVTCFAIRYSWIHVLDVHIPHVEFERQQPIPVNEVLLQSYVGVYSVTSGTQLTITIKLVNGTLMMEAPGQPRHLLLPVSETTFLVAGMENCRIEFLPESGGETHQLRLFQNGKSSPAQR